MNIIIIGCGNIGFRHLESILNLDAKKNIYIVDKSDASIDRCKNLLYKNDDQNLSSFFFKSIDDINSNLEIDIAIIASNSNSRASIIRSLFSKVIPTHLILEKLLFTKISDFNFFLDFFKNFKTKVWVNQWLNSEFQFLTDQINSNEKLEVTIYGSQWGLACNSVHFLEWFHELSLRDGLKISNHSFYRVLEAKRAGFYEIFGSIEIVSKNGNKLNLICDDKTDPELLGPLINVKSKSFNLSCKMSPSDLIGEISTFNNAFTNFTQPLKYQSQRTEIVISDLMEENDCCLPSYIVSCNHHLLIYPLFNDYFLANNIDTASGIPIT
tara:strand:+ start:3401 stop:4375 length:975 start_codon:yes stop_codon:yes gene_type:complete